MKKSIITKGIILTLFFLLSNNICKAQSFLHTYFGYTEEKFLATLFEKKKLDEVVNMKIFKREKNKIILTYSAAISEPYGYRVKSTCYFKNNILYKIKEDHRHNKSEMSRDAQGWKVEDGNSVLFGVFTESLEANWYEEDKSRKVSCCSKGFYSTFWSTHKINFELIKILPESRLKNEMKLSSSQILKLKEEYPNLPIGKSAFIVLAEVNY